MIMCVPAVRGTGVGLRIANPLPSSVVVVSVAPLSVNATDPAGDSLASCQVIFALMTYLPSRVEAGTPLKLVVVGAGVMLAVVASVALVL